MATSFLTIKSHVYRVDGNASATWLATTAIECGYSPDLFRLPETKENPNSQQKSQRLKGKARKLAREGPKPGAAAKGAATKGAPQKEPFYIVSIAEFVTLADYIADHSNGDIQVPDVISDFLNRVICLRKHFSAALPLEFPDLDLSENQKMINSLEYVRERLSPFISSQQVEAMAAERDHPESILEPRQLDKILDSIGASKTIQGFLDTNGVWRSREEKGLVPLNYVADGFYDTTEQYIALSLFIADVSKLREEVHLTWVGYKQGDWDIVVASLATNLAIDFVRSMEEDCEKVFANRDDIWFIMETIFRMKCTKVGIRPDFREMPGDEMNFHGYDVANSLFWSTYLLLDWFREKYLSDGPDYVPEILNNYDPTKDRRQMSEKEMFNEDKSILGSTFPELCTVSNRPTRIIAEDELIRGIRTMFVTGRVPFWLIFAIQIYLDIHHTLREDIASGYNMLVVTGKVIRSSIKLNQEFFSSIRTPKWPESKDRLFQKLLDEIDEWVIPEPTQRSSRATKQKTPKRSFELMKNHPLFCGLKKFHLQALFQQYSLGFVNAWETLLYTGHLYNALRSEKLTTQKWSDMELLFSIQGRHAFFLGRPPTRIDEYLKQFTLATGHAEISTTKGSRLGSSQMESKYALKSLQELAPVAQLFKERYCQDSGRVEITGQDVARILANCPWTDRPNSPPGSSLSNGAVTLSLEVGSGPNPMEPFQQGQGEVILTPKQVLHSLRPTVQSEVTELSMDYLKLHRFCWRMLRQIHMDCRSTLADLFGPDTLQVEHQLPALVLYIFSSISKIQKSNPSAEDHSNFLMLSAGRIMDQMLAAGGGEIVSKKILEKRFGLLRIKK